MSRLIFGPATYSGMGNVNGVVQPTNIVQWTFSVTETKDSARGIYTLTCNYSLNIQSGYWYDIDPVAKAINISVSFCGNSRVVKTYPTGQVYRVQGNICSGSISQTYTRPGNINVTVNATSDANIDWQMLALANGPKTLMYNHQIPSDVFYTAPRNLSISIVGHTDSSIKVKGSLTEGSKTSTITISGAGTSHTCSNGGTVTFTGLNNNTNYTFSATSTDNTTKLTATNKSQWTDGKVRAWNCSLVNQQEHDAITASIDLTKTSGSDVYKIIINNISTSKQSDTWIGLTENTTYDIQFSVSTPSGWSSSITKQLTTYYDPISNLQLIVDEKDKWFWSLGLRSKYTYHGTISKYEFRIGSSSDPYQDLETVNHYKRENLIPHTKYEGWVRLTDNHGRTATAYLASIQTLDDRPLYVDGTLYQVFIIDDNGTKTQITPNRLLIKNEDNSKININQIINEDSRLEQY